MRPDRRPLPLLTASLLAGTTVLWPLHGQNELVPPGGPPPLPPVPAAAGAEKLPARPGSGLMDDGNVFNEEERIQMESDLEDFHARTKLTMSVATLHYVHGDSLDEYSRRLLKAWTADAPGVLVVYERGSKGLSFQGTRGAMSREEDMRQLFRMGDRAAKTAPADSTPSQRLRALVQAMTRAGEIWRQTGKLPEPGEASPPPVPESPNSASPPPAPVDFVRDDGNLIAEEAEAALKSELIKFHSRWDFDVYVATETWLAGESAGDWAARLGRLWMPQRRGVVIAWNRGVSEAAAGDSPLGVRATQSGAEFLGPAAMQQIEEAAQNWKTLAGPRGENMAQAAQHILKLIAARAGSTGRTAPGGTAPGQNTIIIGLAGAMVVGSGLLYLFHRLQERLESRSNEQFLFPSVDVLPRLGAKQGGGNVAGGSFRGKP